MICTSERMAEVFGEGNDYSIPSGPALVYMIRRFGYTPYGGDSDKEVCNYYIETSVEGLMLLLRVGGSRCYIRESASREVTTRLHEDYSQPARDWWRKCKQWALTQNDRFLVAAYEDFDLFLSQVTAWLQSQGLSESDIEAIDDEAWEKEGWSSSYLAYRRNYNERIKKAYEEIEPFPEHQGESEFTRECETAVEATMRELLRPVSVRDVYINILGKIDDLEYDEENECAVGEVEHSNMAGYGVPFGAYDDPGLFIDFIHHVRQMGKGNLQEGMRLVMMGKENYVSDELSVEDYLEMATGEEI